MMPRDVSSPSVGCGQSQRSPTEPSVVNVEQFSFFLLNLHGFISHSAELVGVTEELEFQTFVCLNETLLPGERAMPNLVLQRYSMVSRLDRRDSSGWGGVALFARTGFEQCIVHIGDSDVTERSWHILHTDRGPVAVALWYRRREAGEVASIISLDQKSKDTSQMPLVQSSLAISMFTSLLGCESFAVFIQNAAFNSTFGSQHEASACWTWLFRTWDLDTC